MEATLKRQKARAPDITIQSPALPDAEAAPDTIVVTIADDGKQDAAAFLARQSGAGSARARVGRGSLAAAGRGQRSDDQVYIPCGCHAVQHLWEASRSNANPVPGGPTRQIAGNVGTAWFGLTTCRTPRPSALQRGTGHSRDASLGPGCTVFPRIRNTR